MELLDAIGLREAVLIYLVITALLVISMLSAKPTDKPMRASPGSLLFFLFITVLLVVYIITRFQFF
jgi:hypothetical protein